MSRTKGPSADTQGRWDGARRGTNLPRVADYNQMLVLDLIRRSPGISRVELVRQTGLTAQTMSNICRRLVDAGLIRESGRVYAGAGAPRTIFEVDPAGRYTVGLHIDPARLSFVVMDLAGETVGTLTLPTPDAPEPRDLLTVIESTIRDLVHDAGVPAGRLAGIGVGTPGPIDIPAGAVIDAPNLPGWEHVPLRNDLEELLGVRVTIEKDSTAAAVGELWNAAQAPQNLAFVYLGTGVAAGIVLGGEVMRGASSNIGDIGHLSGDPNGPICYCGGRGCLATTAMPANLVGDATARGLLPSVDLGDARAVERELAALCRAAEQGDDQAQEIITRAARSYGRVAGQIANTLDLDTVVFGGPQWRAFSGTFMRIVPGMVDSLFVGHALHQVTIRGTSIGEHVGAVGAASLAMWSTTFDGSAHLFLH